jgi:hypothetical protein
MVWTVVWITVSARAAGEEPVQDGESAYPNAYLTVLGLLFVLLGGSALVILLSRRARHGTVLVGLTLTFVLLTGTALAGDQLAQEAASRVCWYRLSDIPEECLDHKETAEQLGETLTATAAASAVLAGLMLLIGAFVPGGHRAGPPPPDPAPEPAPGLPPDPPRTPDLAAQLSQLGALHTAGHLSDEEFAAAKRRLLRMDAHG